MTEISLVRHGETDWNLQRRIQGRTDIPLNDTGRSQARATGRRLARRRFDGILTSPLSRARETAELIGSELGLAGAPEQVAALVEREYGQAEGMDWLEVERLFPNGTEVPGRETRAQVAERVVPALMAACRAHPGSSLVVVSHGGAIRAVLDSVDPGGEYGPITNGSVHSFRLDDDGLRLIAFDDPVVGEDAEGDALDTQNAVEAQEDGAAR